MSTGSLLKLTDNDIRQIKQVAPKNISVDAKNFDYNNVDILYCNSLQDIYDIYGDLRGKPRDIWEKYKIVADVVLYEEVKELSKHLMALMVSGSKEQEDDIREQLKIVLEYEGELSKTVNENSKKSLMEYKTGASGYLMFTDWTDDEVYDFWNGDKLT